MIAAALEGDPFIAVAALISTVGAVYASRAAKNSKPVGNGFTSHVLGALERLEDKLDTHIAGHVETHSKPG